MLCDIVTMVVNVIYILVLIICGTNSKVILTDESLSDVSSNFIHKDDIDLHVDLPTIKPNGNDNNDELHIINKVNDSVLDVNNEDLTNTNKTITKCDAVKSSENSIDSEENDKDVVPCEEEVKVDNGTALILTPLIKEGKIEEIRNASAVDPKLFLGVPSFSGFLTVNKTYNSNLFFWYFPVEDKPVNGTPWIVWLQGGPGASSLTGLFDEIGPFIVNYENELIRNPYTWIKNHSVVFIDNPVGTGYSFTDHKEGYAQDMATYSAHLYSAIQQLVQAFPELRTAPLYIAGESYAGKYVPALAMEVHKQNGVPGHFINLQGLILGNAYVDPQMISQITQPFYYFGLLSKEQLSIVNPLLKAFQQDIKERKSVAAKNKWNSLISVLLFLTHQKQAYNFLQDELTVGGYANFLKSSEVKRAIHVGDIEFSFVNLTVNSKMSPDFLSSTKKLFEELLEYYKVLTYCGQLDLMLSCVVTSENYRTWKWSGSVEFMEAKRYPYIFDTRLSGYHKTGGHFTEVVVREAGHMASADAPAPMQNLVARWTHGKPLSERFGLLEGSYVEEYVKNHTTTYL